MKKNGIWDGIETPPRRMDASSNPWKEWFDFVSSGIIRKLTLSVSGKELIFKKDDYLESFLTTDSKGKLYSSIVLYVL